MEDLEDRDATPKRRALDLSLTQVAASALAAVVGAVLASQLGVYGTILGAAVVSVGATTGTAVFQHVFRRTGEQLREMASAPTPIEQARGVPQPAEREETQVFDPFDPGGERTRMMARINPPDRREAVAVYRGRTSLKPRSWRVYTVTATVVFALALGGVGVIELASGTSAANLFGARGGSGSGTPGGAAAPADPSPATPTGQGGGMADRGQRGGDASTGSATSPRAGVGTSASPDPSSPSPTSAATSTPTPHGSAGAGGSGSGSAPGGASGSTGTAAPQPTASP
jgi:hypothetical protein